MYFKLTNTYPVCIEKNMHNIYVFYVMNVLKSAKIWIERKDNSYVVTYLYTNCVYARPTNSY